MPLFFSPVKPEPLWLWRKEGLAVLSWPFLWTRNVVFSVIPSTSLASCRVQMVTFGGERNYLQPAFSCDKVSSLLPSGWSECFSFWSGGAAFPFLVTLVENGGVFSEHCPRATKGVSALCSDAYSDTAPVLSSVLAVILHCAFPKVFQSSFNSLSPCLKSLG